MTSYNFALKKPEHNEKHAHIAETRNSTPLRGKRDDRRQPSSDKQKENASTNGAVKRSAAPSKRTDSTDLRGGRENIDGLAGPPARSAHRGRDPPLRGDQLDIRVFVIPKGKAGRGVLMDGARMPDSSSSARPPHAF